MYLAVAFALLVVLAQRNVPAAAFIKGTAVWPSSFRERDAASVIRPGFDEHVPRWVDTQGNRIEAHGAGVLRSPHDGRWYWYGESRKGDMTNPGVNCYSAKSLAGPWEPHGRVLSSSDIELDGWSEPFIVERPKVIYNRKTKKYVMWAHVDHVRSPEALLSFGMSPEVAKRVCDAYFESTSCSWTSEWSCPTQTPGSGGLAEADDSLGYKCCCDMKMWMKLSAAECAPFKAADKCKWTQKHSCPGQPMGSSGLASDHQSAEYQCCCDYGMWNVSVRAAPSLIQGTEERSRKSRSGRRAKGKMPQLELFTMNATMAVDTEASRDVRQQTRNGRHERRQKVDGQGGVGNREFLEAPDRKAAEYVLRRVVVATSSKPAGPFKLEHIITPDGVPSLDLNLWVDDDGVAYFIRSCDNAYSGISRLTDDYLNTTGMLSKGPLVEGMAVFRHTNGTLYMMTSHLTGWNPNPLTLFRADGPNLEDPQWVDVGNPTKDPTSFNTQPTTIVQYTTKSGFTYSIYMADNWVYGGRLGLLDAAYVWLPIRFDGYGGVHVDRRASWSLEDPFGH